ncbi:MAG: exodeoxyribonuclease III [Bacilli bacterium]|nr:exodeoxyribonuclease III [Bacilli bacterium]
MKIISWNVAGFRAVLNKGFDEFFDKENADVYCLQEAKVLKEQLDYSKEGYEIYLNPAEKKGYSGTLVFTRIKPLNVTYGMGIQEHDNEGRIINLEFKDFYLINLYVPNAKRDLSRLDYRMTWEDDFKAYVKKLEEKKPVVICGDFNVAHTENDIKNARANVGKAGFTYEERDKFTVLLESGLIDTWRYFNPEEKNKYTWWSYMGHARENNSGWRLDYFLISKDYISKVNSSKILDDVMGSDHCPIELDLEME